MTGKMRHPRAFIVYNGLVAGTIPLRVRGLKGPLASSLRHAEAMIKHLTRLRLLFCSLAAPTSKKRGGHLEGKSAEEKYRQEVLFRG